MIDDWFIRIAAVFTPHETNTLSKKAVSHRHYAPGKPVWWSHFLTKCFE